MTTSEALHVWVRGGILLTIALLGAYRRYVQNRPRQQDAIPFRRQYEPIEPGDSQADYAGKARDALIAIEKWMGRFVAILLVIGFAIVIKWDPVTRVILLSTGVLMLVVAVLWTVTRKRESESTDWR